MCAVLQVAAVDIRNLCGKHKSRYSVVRQIIEKSLKKKATVNFSEQLLLGEKLKGEPNFWLSAVVP